MNPVLKISKNLLFLCVAWLLCTAGFIQAQDTEPRATAGGYVKIQIKSVPAEDVSIISDQYLLNKNGTVMLPYLEAPVKLSGLTGQQAADKLTKLYKQAQIFSTPIFMVNVSAGDEKSLVGLRYVHVTGNVGAKKNMPYREGLTLIEALVDCGDITDYGSRHIQVTRKGETRTYDYFSTRDRALKLLPGDVVYVRTRSPFESRPDRIGP